MKLALLLLAASAATAHATPADDVLALVNKYRAIAGVPPVALDPELSAGCMEHANYMKLNARTSAMAGLSAHHQNPRLPGATPAGAKCGAAADLFPGVSDLGTAVDGWIDSLYHRRPMLSPQLQTIGVGYAQNADGTLMAALMFVDRDSAIAPQWPVAYPAANQRDLPLEFGNEVPDPIPGGGAGGFPITLQFPPFDKVRDVSAKLVDQTGAAVPFYLSDPEHPATSFGQYGVICVIPKARLRPGTTYTASITYTWLDREPETRTWKFTSVGLVSLAASDEAGLLAHLGKSALVKGTVGYGGMMDSETVFLQLDNDAKRTKLDMVSILIPLAVWKQLSPSAPPKQWIGRTVEVASAPQLVQTKYLNLPIVEARQLH